MKNCKYVVVDRNYYGVGNDLFITMDKDSAYFNPWPQNNKFLPEQLMDKYAASALRKYIKDNNIVCFHSETQQKLPFNQHYTKLTVKKVEIS